MVGEKSKNIKIIGFVVCCLLFIIVGCLSGTRAYFGNNISGDLTSYTIYYLANYPDGLGEETFISKERKILDNMFLVPDGYKFDSWNTKRDGSGEDYYSGDDFTLKEDLWLYAKWMVVINYGDVNLDLVVDNNDYMLLDSYLKGEVELLEQGIKNADVNNDGKIDLVDVDILKQVCLGNSNYLGYLPNEPVLIYDIYEGNIEIDNDNKEDTDKNDDGNKDNATKENNDKENIVGNGNTGNQSGNGNSLENSVVSGDNGNSNSNDKIVDSEINKDSSEKLETEIKYYDFKFMNKEEVYDNTRCVVLENGICELALPDNPKMDGYKFKGWSIDKNCSDGLIINASVMVDSSNVYYACFIEDREINRENNYYVYIIVLVIFCLSGRMIWYLIKKFRKNNEVS